jgi:hypothetical protein
MAKEINIPLCAGGFMSFRLLLLGMLLVSRLGFADTSNSEKPFFYVSQQQPYHLSIGAVLFDEAGRIACHHFENVLGYDEIYILMRESMEDGETPLMTLHRGLREEFGATAEPVVFLGCLSGWLCEPHLLFEKTTLYIACQVKTWNPEERDQNDPEAVSTIEWKEPYELIGLMQQQGERFKRVDADESEMIRRALPYIQQTLNSVKT